ncbi:MAG: ferrochelatase [Parvularculaceae bacterium]
MDNEAQSTPRRPYAADRAEARPADHPDIAAGRTGVLIVNLGTPEAPTPGAVRAYLAEFLSDTRVVDYPRVFWLPILYGVILNVRPAKSARAYAKIWTAQGSPLRRYAVGAAEKLAARYGERLIVDWAMRYGAPSIRERIGRLQARGCERIVIVPLYPQYSQSTSASVADAAFDALKQLKWQPALRIAAPFYDAPDYIAALKAGADAHMHGLGWAPERVVISFHGVPKRFLDHGDPYYCHCAKTARLLRAAMGWSEEFAPLAFQSKFGREEWLTPATDATIEALAREGVKRLAVITPGFMADCLETLEEIDIAARASFMAAGGEAFTTVPCLNDSPALIELLSSRIEIESAGWRGRDES